MTLFSWFEKDSNSDAAGGPRGSRNNSLGDDRSSPRIHHVVSADRTSPFLRNRPYRGRIAYCQSQISPREVSYSNCPVGVYGLGHRAARRGGRRVEPAREISVFCDGRCRVSDSRISVSARPRSDRDSRRLSFSRHCQRGRRRPSAWRLGSLNAHAARAQFFEPGADESLG